MDALSEKMGTAIGSPCDKVVLMWSPEAETPSIAIESHDRKALERIIRYMGRPPLSNERISLAPDGHRLIVTLKTPWRDGTSQIVLTPFELMERLVALVPPPRKNQIRYHGCFGSNCHIRKRVVSAKEPIQAKSNRIGRPSFARLMARIFAIDVLACPRCDSKLKVISFITDPKPIRDILKALKMSTAPPTPSTNQSAFRVEYDQQDGPIFAD